MHTCLVKKSPDLMVLVYAAVYRSATSCVEKGRTKEFTNTRSVSRKLRHGEIKVCVSVSGTIKRDLDIYISSSINCLHCSRH